MAYTTINLQQFRAILTDENGWSLVENFGEYVLEWQIPSMPRGCVIKVYTSIRKSNALSRFKGEDSIKVCCVFRNQGLVKRSSIYRVPGWQDRLKAAIRLVLATAKSRRQFIQGDQIVWSNAKQVSRTPAMAPRMPRRSGAAFLPAIPDEPEWEEYSDEPDLY